MWRTGRMAVLAAVLAVFALASVGCAPPTTIDTVKVPEGFDFSTTRDVTVKVTVADGTGQVSGGTEVVVANTEKEIAAGDFIVRGVTNDRGEFERLLRVPARFDALRVRVSPSGVASETDVSIVNNEAFVAFGPSS